MLEDCNQAFWPGGTPHKGYEGIRQYTAASPLGIVFCAVVFEGIMFPGGIATCSEQSHLHLVDAAIVMLCMPWQLFLALLWWLKDHDKPLWKAIVVSAQSNCNEGLQRLSIVTTYLNLKLPNVLASWLPTGLCADILLRPFQLLASTGTTWLGASYETLQGATTVAQVVFLLAACMVKNLLLDHIRELL